jgi:hypothetical protein
VGLHLNYDLRLDHTTSPEAAANALRALHARAQTLPFAHVSPFMSEATATTDDLQQQWHSLRRWASIVTMPGEDEVITHTFDVDTTAGFLVYPGEGSESAWFGLLRRQDPRGCDADWYWTGFCKTQYASIVSDAHLITCHTSLVTLLDAAIEIGFEVTVFDETCYWETRDEARLLHEVGKMNRIVAAFAGRLSDAMGESNRLAAPIFQHPQFERLEMGDDA